MSTGHRAGLLLMALATLGGLGAWAAPLMLKGSTALHVLTIADGSSGTAPQRAVGQRMAERHRNAGGGSGADGRRQPTTVAIRLKPRQSSSGPTGSC